MSDVILFYKPEKEYGCFSNWYLCKFVFLGVEYCSSEQYMMHQKALLFGDEVVAKKILLETDQMALKKLGRDVANYDEDRWCSAREQIMRRGLRAKFFQNKELKEILLSTGDAIIGEASPRDKIWGIGRGMNKPENYDPSTWTGENLLGKVLMQVRDDLRRWDGTIKKEILKKKIKDIRNDEKYRTYMINYLFSLPSIRKMNLEKYVELNICQLLKEFRRTPCDYRMLLAVGQDLIEMESFV